MTRRTFCRLMVIGLVSAIANEFGNDNDNGEDDDDGEEPHL